MSGHRVSLAEVSLGHGVGSPVSSARTCVGQLWLPSLAIRRERPSDK